MKFKIFLTGLTIIILNYCGSRIYGQLVNNNPNKSYINMNLPKSPESSTIEKYGNYEVNQLNGLPNISIPLANINGGKLNLPVTLNYNAGGIRVSQEATWVGLGFDLNAGGRVTVEIKGRPDNEITAGFLGGNRLKTYMPKIFRRLGYSNDRDILTVASEQAGANAQGNGNITDTLFDDEWTVRLMAAYGLGEPDIYHANFMGNSLSFYFDIVNGNLKFIGENSLFRIRHTVSADGTILDFEITDNDGVEHFFTQKEISISTPPAYDPTAGVITTAWLLTKMIHPSGDSIVLRYNSYGQILPAYDWDASYSGTYAQGGGTFSDDFDNERNRTKITTAYLTQIESKNTIANFNLSNRNDIKGASKKLDDINILDKITNTVVNNWHFNYDYFVGNVNAIISSLPDSVKNWAKLRLKLNSLTANKNNQFQQPYKFYYNESVTIPHKYTFSQDHWGFLNDVNHNAIYYTNNPQSYLMIPTISSLTGEGLQGNPPTGVIPISGFANRTCNSVAMLSMTMDSIIYPIGGSTKFQFGPHQSWYFGTNMNLVGGGLRVEKISNYDGLGNLASKAKYIYEEGRYLGIISYMNIFNKVDKGVGPPGAGSCSGGSAQSRIDYNFSNRGNLNQNDILVGYSKITEISTNANDLTLNGQIIKYFKVTPYFQMSSLLPQLRDAHRTDPLCYSYSSGAGILVGSSIYLNAPWYKLPPAPLGQLDGKLLREEYKNSQGDLMKSTDYYYSQAGYSQNLFSIKVKDNLYQGVEACGPLCAFTAGYCYGQRRYTMVVSPAKSYYTLTDSIVEKTYQGNDFISQKKSFKYNNFYQPEFTTSYNSDGTQNIVYSKTSLSFDRPHIPSGGQGDGLMIENLKNAHLYNLPIEQINIKRTNAGDSLVTQSIYNRYDYSKLKNVFLFSTNNPKLFRSQFVPAFYLYDYPTLPSFDIQIDPNYKIEESAEYDNANLIKELTSKTSKSSFIQDNFYNTLLAKCSNASFTDIAYTSFETTTKGNWIYNNMPIVNNGVTGKYVYNLTNGNISNANLDINKIYIVSYWSNNGIYTVSGSISTTTGRIFNGWTYYEHKITGQASIVINGNGLIDELRLYPDKSFMTSYTYEPLIGMSSQCDANNRISYYEYDNFNRLSLIKDQDNNILKKICYNYAGQIEDCPLTNNTAAQWRATGNTRCQPCSSNPIYNNGVKEKEEKDINPNSGTANFLRWVVDPSGTCPPAPPIYAPRNDLAYCENVNGVNTGNLITPTYDSNPCSPTYLTGWGPNTITPNHPPCLPCPACLSHDYKCINGVCTLGVLKVIRVRKLTKYTWECTKAMCFPDGTFDANNLQTFTSSTPCAIECF